MINCLPERCSTCTSAYHPIPFDGPADASILVLAERPGQTEEFMVLKALRTGMWPEFLCLVGDAGKEFNDLYLPLAGLDRCGVRVGNTVACLVGQSLVVLEDGSTRRIAEIVANRQPVRVQSIDQNGNLSSCRVVDWHRTPCAGRKIFQVRFRHYKPQGSYVTGGVRLTEDHELMTNVGWLPTSEIFLRDDLTINTGTPGLSRRQLGAVIGMVLGDARLNSRNIDIRHGTAQAEYCSYKGLLLSNLGIADHSRPAQAATLNQPVCESLNGKVSKSRKCDWEFIKEYFDEASLAIWFLDDGCYRKPNRTKKGSKFATAELTATQRDSDELKMFSELIYTRFGIKSKVSKGRIYFNRVNTPLLSALVAPYATPDMRYKVASTDPPFNPELYWPDAEAFWDKPVITESSIPDGRKMVYCLTTEHQNFVTKGGVVHNCGKDNNKRPTQAEIDGCAGYHVRSELQALRPEVVVLMGAVAASICIDIETGERPDLEVQHGIPFKGRIFDWEGWVVVMYHPAAGLHNTSLMMPLLADWEALRRWLKRPIAHHSATRTGKRDYRLCRTVNEVDQYFIRYTALHRESRAGVDTESHAGAPFSIQASITPGTGMMILTGDARLSTALGYWLQQYRLVFHHAPADIDIVRKYCRIPVDDYMDTLVVAYNIGNLPQGLKALAYRLLGIRRKSWDEVVGWASKMKLLMWMLEAYDVVQTGLTSSESRVGKRGQPIKPLVVKSPLENKLAGISRYTQQNPEYDPWERLNNVLAARAEMEANTEWWHMQAVIERIGPWPLKGVANLPLDEARDYGCMDADNTLELALVLDQKRDEAEAGWDVQEDDWDVIHRG